PVKIARNYDSPGEGGCSITTTNDRQGPHAYVRVLLNRVTTAGGGTSLTSSTQYGSCHHTNAQMWCLNTPPWNSTYSPAFAGDAAHEIMHLLGNPDNYAVGPWGDY